jgi:hypothetical protein
LAVIKYEAGMNPWHQLPVRCCRRTDPAAAIGSCRRCCAGPRGRRCIHEAVEAGGIGLSETRLARKWHCDWFGL